MSTNNDTDVLIPNKKHPIRSKSVNLKIIKDIAESKGGKCLSNQYLNSHTKMKFKCSKGHIWEAEPNSIKQGCWCRCCANTIRNFNKNGLDEAIEIAIAKGGKCLSNIYTGCDNKLLFICKQGHQWYVQLTKLKRGDWCPYCSRHILIEPLKELQQIAEEKGGKCLSEEYINWKSKLEFQCKEGHIFKLSSNELKNGKWCQYCTIYKSEEICRNIFNSAFNVLFKRSKPIISPITHKKLELDGYNEELKLAFEYNGKQHYIDNIFETNKLDEIIQKDKIKIDYCKQNNITLIIIPYTIKTSIEELYRFIREEYQRLTNIHFPVINTKLIDISSIYNRSKFEEIQKIAIIRGGKCISKSYINCKTKLLFECNKGHRWWSISSSIMQGHWCPHCKEPKKR